MKRLLLSVALVLLTVSLSGQGPSALLHVGATVTPHCRIAVDDGAVTTSCAASSLRALRVTTSHGETLAPTRGGRWLRAGGDAVFVVQPLIARAADADGRMVVVTLDF